MRNLRNHMRGVVLFFINHLMSGNYLWEVKNSLLRLCGVKIGEKVKIVGPMTIDVCSNLEIGDECWIGKNFSINGNKDVIIGKNCDLAPDVCFETGTHKIGDGSRRAGEGYCEPIVIGDGCWLGVRVTVLSGVTIGAGSVVAAGAVVTRNVSPNVVVGGVPAKTIKKLEV